MTELFWYSGARGPWASLEPYRPGVTINEVATVEKLPNGRWQWQVQGMKGTEVNRANAMQAAERAFAGVRP